jgi:hypothetical protein
LSFVLMGQGVSDLQGVNFDLLPLTDRPTRHYSIATVQHVMEGMHQRLH